MMWGHLYGMLTLLTIFVGLATLTLGALSAFRSKERYLKYFLVILGAFNLKFLIDLAWSYIILNIAPFPRVLFMIDLAGSCASDLLYIFFLMLLWNSLFGLNLSKTILAAVGIGLSGAFVLMLASGTYDPEMPQYRPAWPAGAGNLFAVLVFLGVVIVGFVRFGRLHESRHKFFLAITLACSCLGLIQMAGSAIFRLSRLPNLVIRAPLPQEIGFPWLSAYFGLYMAAVIYFFLKYYLLAPAAPPSQVDGVPESAAGISSKNATMDRFCGKYEVSTRERDILKLVLEGCGNKEIGKRLFISTGTVKTHMHNLFRKTGTESRTRLVHLILG